MSLHYRLGKFVQVFLSNGSRNSLALQNNDGVKMTRPAMLRKKVDVLCDVPLHQLGQVLRRKNLSPLKSQIPATS
jgi:hypothetical protein